MLKKLIISLMATFPHLEVVVKAFYWRSQWVYNLRSKFALTSQSSANSSHSGVEKKISLSVFERAIRAHDINNGDILIVHSSVDNLHAIDGSLVKILNLLSKIVGDEGTLVMPAIPKYPQALSGPDRLTANLSEDVWLYDVKKTPPWTGILPYLLMKTAGARRSRHPLNTLVALGKYADKMFLDELQGETPTPCGPQSAWAFCESKNAKILTIDAGLAHSLTMVHVAEDCNEAVWPIPDWYRFRQFRVVDDGFDEIVTVRERHPKWTINFCERKLDRDLQKSNIVKQSQIGPVALSSLSSLDLKRFLKNHPKKSYPYYFWRNKK